MSNRLRVIALLLLPLLVHACACSDGEVTERAPRLVLEQGAERAGEAWLVDFGAVGVGASAEKLVLVRNAGSTPLRLEKAEPEAPFALEEPPAILAAGASAVLRLRFAPERPGPRSARLAFASNGGGLAIDLRGTGVSPQVTCAPLSIDFGNVVIGSHAQRTIACTNHANVKTALRANATEGPNARAFSHDRIDAVPLAPGDSVEITVTASPGDTGALSASFAIEADGTTVANVALAAMGQGASLQLEPDGCLDFGFVLPGAEAERTLTVRNLAASPLEIRSATLQGAADFSLGAAAPAVLPTDDPATGERENEWTISLRFSPVELGAREGTFRLATSDARDPVIDVCLRGFGGGPVLTCGASGIDFGQGAIDVPLVRHLVCTNTGADAPGTEEDNLRVLGVSTATDEFAAAIEGGVPGDGYPAGAAFVVTVTWLPRDEGIDADALTLATNEPAIRTVPIAGEALDLLPCGLRMQPEALHFGRLPPGLTAELDALLHNVGRGPCLLRDVIVDGAGFSLAEPAPSAITLAAGETTRLRVRFTPGDGEATGALRFVASDPAAPQRTIPLSGSGLRGCLRIVPERLDFGLLAPGCSTTQRSVRLFNTCPGPVTVASASTASPFAITGGALPIELLEGDAATLQLTYAPQREGSDRALLQVATSEGGAAFTVPLEGRAAHDADQIDRWIQQNDNAVDVLLVIDNSGSMASEQEEIAANLPSLLEYAQTQGTDFQIGVTTTGVYSEGGGCPGGANGGEDGRLFPVDGSHPRILTRTTPDLAAHYAHNTQVGICHGNEQGLEAAYRALSSPVIDHADDPRHPAPNDGNAGFVRSDASLSIVFVSDDDDHSPTRAGSYYDHFLSLKGWDPSRVSVHAIVGMDETCEDIANVGERYLDVVARSGGRAHDICTDDWRATLRSIGTAAFATRDRFPLSGVPAETNGDGVIGAAELDVRVNGFVVQANRWSYDPAGNQVIFHPLARPEAGDQVEVRYRMACLGGDVR